MDPFSLDISNSLYLGCKTIKIWHINDKIRQISFYILLFPKALRRVFPCGVLEKFMGEFI